MFEGFTPEALTFFTALRFNNNREFFEANRETYENEIRKPLIAMAEALAPVVQEVDPQLDIRPARTVSRIHRDLRFSNNKTPYRDHMWIGFRRVGESRQETCGFYFDISDTASNWGCGFYHMQPETMQQLRKKLVKESKRILKIVEEPAFKARFEVMGDAYVRQHQPPEGMAAPLGALYRKKSVYVEHHMANLDDLFSLKLVEVIAADFKVIAPFYDLMRECMVKVAE